MTKRVLVIGTSHSVGVCGERILPKGRRWHDHIKTNYDAEVVSLKFPGCTSLGQFFALSSYFYDNPDQYFDLCIIEGRHKEYTVDSAMEEVAFIDPKDEHFTWARENYDHWLDEDQRLAINPMRNRHRSRTVSTSLLKKLDKPTRRLYEDYMSVYFESSLQNMHSISHNFSICALAKQRCETVKWFSWPSHTVDDLDFYNLMQEVLYPYLMMSLYPTITKNVPQHYKCECGHLNEHANRHIFKILKPEIDKILEEKDGQ